MSLQNSPIPEPSCNEDKMQLTRYSDKYKTECFELFLSNTPKFFADWEYEQFEKYLENYATTEMFYVLLNNGKIVGCGGYEESDDAIELIWCMIHSSLHKKQYGSILLSLRLEEIKKQFASAVVNIETTQVAEGFFKKHGFQVVNCTQDGFGKGLDKVDMQLNIY